MIVNVGILEEARRNKGWSGWTETATECGVSPATLDKLLRGQKIRPDALDRISRGLGLPASKFISGSYGEVKGKVYEMKERTGT